MLAQLPADADVQCFYHLYKIAEVQNARSGEQSILPANNYDVFASMQGTLGSVDGVLERWDFERVKALGDSWADDYASVRNLLLQLNSLHAVTGLLSSFAPDFVVFVRPDLEYHNALPSYIFQRPEARRRNVYIPNWQWWGGVNDRFAVCGRDTYKAYGRRIEQIFAFCEATGRKLHSERLLKFALQQAGAKVHTLPTTASRVRINGAYAAEDFSGKRGMGKRENRYYHLLARLRTGWEVLRR